MKIRSSLFAVMLCALPCIQSIAAPVNDEDRISVDIRRTTFLVNDIDTSLQLYRDALGLNVIYDQMIKVYCNTYTLKSPSAKKNLMSRSLVTLLW